MRNSSNAGYIAVLGVCIVLGLMFNGIGQQPEKIAAASSARSVSVNADQQLQQATATPTGEIESFSTKDSNIRSGPGTEYTILRTVKANTPLDIVGYNDDKGKDKVWYTLRDGGWISGSLVKNPPADVDYVAALVGGTPITNTPTPTATSTPTSTPDTPTPTSSPTPSECLIKGNVSYNTGEKIYHVPGQEYYDETVINSRYGERWFCTEDEARAAGWRRARN